MDNRIAMMGKPINIDPLNSLIKSYQIGKMERGEAAYDRALRQQNLLNKAWQQSGGDPNKLRSLLIQGGQGSMVPDIEQSFAKVAKTQGEADRASSEGILKRMDASRRTLEGVNDPRSFVKWQLGNLNDPVMGEFYRSHGIDEQAILDEVQEAMQSPEAFQRLLNESKLGLDKIMENVYQQQNLGDRSVIKSLPKYGTGPVSTVSEEQIGRSPNVSPPARGDMTDYQKEKLRLEEERLKVIQAEQQRKQSTRGDMTDYQKEKLRLEEERLKVSQAEQTRKQSTMVDLPPKVRQAREAAYPKATMAVKDFGSKAESLIKDLETLRDSEGLWGMTGLVFGITPNARPETRKANALFKKILARGSFQELANMKAVSPTGGALGQVSDFENKKLERSFGGLDTTMDTEDFKDAIDQVIGEIKSSQQRTQEAYDIDYEYRASDTTAKPSEDEGWTDL